jgi:hypothetical protein
VICGSTSLNSSGGRPTSLSVVKPVNAIKGKR